ncbi:MAG TPA: peptide chain release factor N(5)-glutamine methyltransferase [Candidatus Limnocylindria bacterium]|nr:peptide chain release factor N(5)-glutamine methyltransferase [Candidatus Limnocylindria bacterium]
MPSAVAVTVTEWLDSAAAELGAAGVETPRVDAEWLLAHCLAVERMTLRLAPARALDDEAAARYAAAVARRARREPLQQIVGSQEFRSVRMRVTRDVLVPRPETEVLVEWALELLPAGDALVVDVGTGSGCIACAIAAERPAARVVAIERSLAAAAVARDNAAPLGARVRVLVGDLLAPLGDHRADLIVSNPPYLDAALMAALPPEVAEFEPRVAVDGGADGLDVIRPLVAGAHARLRPGAALVLETAGAEQAHRVAALLRAADFTQVSFRRDLAGVERFVAGRVPAEVA